MPADASPAGSERLPVVSVIGEAIVHTEPDAAVVDVTLHARDADPGPALEEVTRRGEALVALLDELQVGAADRSTTGVSVREDFHHSSRGRRSDGHNATMTVAVRLRDPELIGRLITRATVELGAHIGGPAWRITPDHPARLEAARLAAANGKRKAEAFAEGIGARLGRLIHLAERDRRVTYLQLEHESRAVAAAASAPIPIESGEQGVVAAVEVTFALERA